MFECFQKLQATRICSISRSDGNGEARGQEYPYHRRQQRYRAGRSAGKAVLRTNNPSKRLAEPLEIAKLAVYLASDDSAYVVGADFLIDGGVTAISGVGA